MEQPVDVVWAKDSERLGPSTLKDAAFDAVAVPVLGIHGGEPTHESAADRGALKLAVDFEQSPERWVEKWEILRRHAVGAYELIDIERVQVAHAPRICSACAADKWRDTSQSLPKPEFPAFPQVFQRQNLFVTKSANRVNSRGGFAPHEMTRAAAFPRPTARDGRKQRCATK